MTTVTRTTLPGSTASIDVLSIQNIIKQWDKFSRQVFVPKNTQYYALREYLDQGKPTGEFMIACYSDRFNNNDETLFKYDFHHFVTFVEQFRQDQLVSHVTDHPFFPHLRDFQHRLGANIDPLLKISTDVLLNLDWDDLNSSNMPDQVGRDFFKPLQPITMMTEPGSLRVISVESDCPLFVDFVSDDETPDTLKFNGNFTYNSLKLSLSKINYWLILIRQHYASNIRDSSKPPTDEAAHELFNNGRIDALGTASRKLLYMSIRNVMDICKTEIDPFLKDKISNFICTENIPIDNQDKLNYLSLNQKVIPDFSEKWAEIKKRLGVVFFFSLIIHKGGWDNDEVNKLATDTFDRDQVDGYISDVFRPDGSLDYAVQTVSTTALTDLPFENQKLCGFYNSLFIRLFPIDNIITLYETELN